MGYEGFSANAFSRGLPALNTSTRGSEPIVDFNCEA